MSDYTPQVGDTVRLVKGTVTTTVEAITRDDLWFVGDDLNIYGMDGEWVKVASAPALHNIPDHWSGITGTGCTGINLNSECVVVAEAGWPFAVRWKAAEVIRLDHE